MEKAKNNKIIARPKRGPFLAINKTNMAESNRHIAKVVFCISEYSCFNKMNGPAERRISNAPAGRGFPENR